MSLDDASMTVSTNHLHRAIVASVITMYYRVQIFFALTDINADANYAGYVVLLCGFGLSVRSHSVQRY